MTFKIERFAKMALAAARSLFLSAPRTGRRATCDARPKSTKISIFNYICKNAAKTTKTPLMHEFQPRFGRIWQPLQIEKRAGCAAKTIFVESMFFRCPKSFGSSISKNSAPAAAGAPFSTKSIRIWRDLEIEKRAGAAAGAIFGCWSPET